jgi:hypothetical protein
MRPLVLAAIVAASFSQSASSRDVDGRFANSTLKPWFEGLHSKKGPCCSDADGALVKDADWETYRGQDGKSHYRVAIRGELVDVPDEAVITEPNRYGPAMVWGYESRYFKSIPGAPVTDYVIRCFLPGVMG